MKKEYKMPEITVRTFPGRIKTSDYYDGIGPSPEDITTSAIEQSVGFFENHQTTLNHLSKILVMKE